MLKDWKFRFKDLGPVKDATLELGDLTIITGRNNTGKTYIVYTLYGFLRDFSELAEEVMDIWAARGSFSFKIPFSIETIAETLLRTGNFELSFSEKDFYEDRAQMIRHMCRQYSHNKIDNVFNARAGTFSRTVFDAEEDQGKSGISPIGLAVETQIGGDLSIIFNENRLFFTYARDRKKETEVRADELIQRLLLENNLKQTYVRYLFGDSQDFFMVPNCCTSVRLAISLFYSELESKRRFTVRKIQQAANEYDQGGDLLSPEEIIRTYTSRYALPIDDEIEFTKTIPDFSSDWVNSEKREAEKDLERIVGGSFTKSGGILYFIPSEDNPREDAIPLHLSSSSAAEMSRLFFGLVLNREDPNPLLIIDEPESHLDTMNQIKLARALVRWVKSGMKILISTHSDFIVKEINNLIMLHGSFDNKEKLLKDLRYKDDDSIDPSAIKAYYVGDGGLVPCSMNEFGIEVPSFEDSIDELVRVSGVLGSRIILEGDENE